MRIGVINNLGSGRNRAGVTRLLEFLRGHPEVLHVETESMAAVPEALGELARLEVELLVVNGGDGSVQDALTQILGEREFDDRVPLIAVLRGGRTNMTAIDLGTGRDPVRAMARLIEAAKSGRLAERTLRRRVLRVEYGQPASVVYGMFFGAGVIHRGIEIVHRLFPRGRSQGVFGASLVTGALVSRTAVFGGEGGALTPDKIHMLIDGETLERGESRVAMATSLGRLFAGLRPFWGRGPGGVRFTAISSDARRFARLLPGILAGCPGRAATEENGYLSRNARRVALRLDCGFTVDGELVSPEEGRIVRISADDSVRFVSA